MSLRCTLLLCAVVTLSACGGGTKLVKHAPSPPQRDTPLATAVDGSLKADLDWVIVRNGPGAWAKNADWDEYLIRVRNTSNSTAQITAVALVDSQEHSAPALGTRKALVQASRQTVRRYEDSGLKVKAGMGGAALTATGVGTGLGTGAAIVGSGASLGAAAAGVVVVAVAAPAAVIAGVIRMRNNSKVNHRIEQRHSVLPIAVAAGENRSLDVFFPLSPSPRRIEISYADARGVHQLDIDTTQALAGLHLESSTVENKASMY
jgi:hypothetical protein